MKAKDMFNTLFQIEELTEDEFTSIIWSNPVEDDFISTMCALIDFFPKNLTKHNSSFKTDCSNANCPITSMNDNKCDNQDCTKRMN